MQCPQVALVVPPGLEAVLEAVTRAVLERNPNNIIEFFALYFEELVSFQKGLFCWKYTNLDVTELIEKFEYISGRKSTPGSNAALSPAVQEHSSIESLCSMRDVATSVQTVDEDSQTSEGERTPVEEAAEDASPVSAARASVESVKSQPSTAGKQGPSDSQADVSTTDVNKAPSVAPLQEEPAPPALLLPPALPEDTSEPVPFCSKENGDEGLEKKTSELSGESKQKDTCTEKEDDHLPEEADIQYSSKETQYPSVAGSIAGSKSTPGSDGALSPAEPEPVCVPAEPAQLAEHVRGSSDSLCSMRDVATSVQTIDEDSQTSEGERTPVEEAAEDASPVSAARASVESVKSQPSTAGKQGPSDSQADVSTTDVNKAPSVAPLQEEPAPPALPEDTSEPVPFCSKENEDEGLQEKASEFSGESKQKDVCTDTEEDRVFEEPDIQYNSQETQYPSVPGSVAGRKSTLGTDGAPFPAGPELAYVPAEPAQLAEHVRAMASSAAGQPPPPHSNVWTLYCLTDLRQGQKPPPSLPSAGAGVAYFQATLCPSRGGDQHCAPIYVVQEDGKKGDAPPFILVGSNVQNTQDWKRVPSHAVFVQQDAGARKRLTTVRIPVARPADEETDSSKSAEETGAKPCTPTVVSVAIPLADVMAAKRGSPAGGKHTGINALAESSGAAG
ncbi:calcium-binding tyrosine phosphorylation-regulated protein [Apus apus]|uniref:calcium-binding tyrosine phosphorylation-regulated protein n=1 Tax=Apus apus TaxID=8895 RepID=UPI0021F8E234|nr:calcium-binding tyrosine phosphorylation-regulated protein [Apus apus]